MAKAPTKKHSAVIGILPNPPERCIRRVPVTEDTGYAQEKKGFKNGVIEQMKKASVNPK
jgi:hypothetical protein